MRNNPNCEIIGHRVKQLDIVSVPNRKYRTAISNVIASGWLCSKANQLGWRNVYM